MIGPTRRKICSFAGASLLASAAKATASPSDSATAVVAHELQLAATEGKGVLIVFFASWCGWCVAMDRFLENSDTQRIVGARFRILRMRVLENEVTIRSQEFSGADALYHHYAQDIEGVPFLVFLSSNGQVLTTTRSDDSGENIGFPGTHAEYAWFDRMIERALPGASPIDRAVLRATCQQLNPERG